MVLKDDEPRMTPRMHHWVDYIRNGGRRIPVHGTDVIVLNRLVRYGYLEYFNQWYILGPRLISKQEGRR